MSRPRVLLVDDESSVLLAVARVLESENYDVVTASGGTQALRLYCESPCALAILDVNMPHPNGWHTLEQLREINPRLPVIIITARPNQQEKGRLAGVDAVMEKPLDLPRLLELIANILAAPH